MSSAQAILKAMGQTLAQQRKNKGLTQAGLAQIAGVSKRTLERLESGNSIQLIGFIRVLESLGVLAEFNALFARPEKNKASSTSIKPSNPDTVSPSRQKPHSKSRSWGIDG